MRTTYNVNPAKAVAGQPMGKRESRPLKLPWLPQISTLTSDAGNGTDDLVITVVDDKTGQSYEVTATGSATEATMLANALAAIRASELNNLFSVSGEVDTDVIITFTARHANRTYTISATGGPADTNAVAETQAAGGAGIRLGRFVCETTEGELSLPGSSTALAEVAGVLFRTDGNHFRSALEDDTPDAVDTLARGKTYPVMTKGRVYLECLEDMAVGDSVFLVCEASDSADLGKVRASATGSAQVSTVTPVENMLIYGFEYGYLGQHYTVQYVATDGTTSVADAVAGLEDAAAENAPSGITISAGETDAVDITTDAGTSLDYLRNTAWSLDTEAASTVVVLGAADDDALDISSIAKVEQGASSGGLVLLRINVA